MSFSSYKTLSATIEQFQIFYNEENFVQEIITDISSYFREDLQLMMQEGVVDNSEFAICENLIYPVIKEVWKSYRHKFLLWSHHYLNYHPELSSFPEYILAQRSPLGKVVFAKPYLLLVEAKQDKFHDAWGQCLAEMVAAQQLNEKPDIVVFGIVSNGVTWEFGKLECQHFTKNTTPFLIYQLDQLFAVTNYIFQQCEIQLEQWLTSTGALQVPATPQESQPELEDDNADIKIGLYQVLGKSELTFEQEGQVIYPLIAAAFNRGKKVVVSFDNVQLITWSFVTKAIGQLYEHFSESQIQSCLQLVDITEEDLEFVHHVMETKKEFLINPEKFRQPMSDEQLEELRRKNPDNPILQVVGMFKDDPTFDDMLAYIAEYRRELDEEYFRQIDAEEVGN